MNTFAFENATDPAGARRGAALLAVGGVGVLAALGLDFTLSGYETLLTVAVGVAAIVALAGAVLFRRSYDL